MSIFAQQLTYVLHQHKKDISSLSNVDVGGQHIPPSRIQRMKRAVTGDLKISVTFSEDELRSIAQKFSFTPEEDRRLRAAELAEGMFRYLLGRVDPVIARQFGEALFYQLFRPDDSLPSFRIRIVEEPLTPHNLTSIISAITELSTKCWLIAHGRFAHLIEYTQTHDARFVEEAQLILTRITYNSPFDASFKIDLSASNLADAIGTTIDGVAQARQRLEKAELENKAKAQEIEQAKQKAEQDGKAALLEQERQELAIERERLEVLEKRLDVQKKGIEYAFEIATKTITVLHPNADEQTKTMLIQTLLPTILQLQNGKGLELALPPPQSSERKTERQENR